MVSKKDILGMFKPEGTGFANSQYQGGVGFDNPRENIDPHVKTKVLDTKELKTYGLSNLNGKLTVNVQDTGAVVDNNISLKRDNVEFMAIGEYLNLYNGIRLPTTNAPNLFFGIANDSATDFDSYFIAGAADLVMQAPTSIQFQIGLANTLVNLSSSNFLIATAIELDGALNHDGTTVGFYGVTPVTRPSAYTQTYSTASRTHSSVTAQALSDSTGGTRSTTLNQNGLGDTIIDDNFASVLNEINALKTDVENVKNVLNSVIDDLQSLGLLQ